MNSGDLYNTPQAGLGDAVPNVQSSLFNFKGRLSVLGYMARSILLSLLMVVVLAIAVYVAQALGLVRDLESGSIGTAAGVAGFLIFIPFVWVAVALLVKRLHDINMSGWFGLLTLIPVLGALFMMFVCLKPGNEAGNRFGAHNPAVGWEKPVGIIGLVLMIGALVLTVGAFVMGLLGQSV